MTIIQLRRGTAAEWTSANPVLNEGEQGLEKDTGKMKIGDGVSNWAALPYFVTGGAAAYGDPTVVLNAGEALPADIPEGAVILRRSAAGGGGDHNSLQNLTVGNPHTQYGLQIQPINAQTNTTYTPVASDLGKLVTLSNTGAITVTLPQDSDVTFPTGGRVDFLVINTGMATFAAGTGATVNATPSAVSRAQWSAVSAIKRAANTWVVVGDLA